MIHVRNSLAAIWLVALAMLVAQLAVSTAASAQGGPPPALGVTIRPVATRAEISRVEVTLKIEQPRLPKGDALLRMPLTIVGIPTAAYEASAIKARDGAGALKLSQEEELPPTPQGTYRRYTVDRATEGDVVVEYAAAPRVVTASTNNGPLFDLRQEAGGIMGAGVGFLALPARKGPFRVSMNWDLSQMAAGSIGVWSLGEGNVQTVGPAEQLAFTFYAAGPLQRYPASGSSRFTLYWLKQPPFAVEELAGRIGRLYDTMSSFFRDSKGGYRVFMRQNPYLGRGGTALPQSFMIGYHAPSRPTADDLQELLAHEMTHNWPRLEGEHGDTAWYSEGTAEYYSLVLAFRAGLLTVDDFLREINQRGNDYYVHPFRELSNEEAAKRFWNDPFVQQVPYGRGFLYLAQTDAAIRAASGGAKSLDDIVLALRARQTSGQPYGIPEWLQLVGEIIGRERAEQYYRRMTSGQILEPGSSFAPCFSTVRQPSTRFELGFARRSLNENATVRELVPGSNAEHAGVREGDTIVRYTDLRELSANSSKRMELVVRRGGAEQTINYLPRGQAVEAYRWVRNPAASATACRF